MNLLDFYIPEWFFVALNLLILVVVLKRFFWTPVAKILDERRAKADKAAQDAEDAARLRDEMELKREQSEADGEARAEALMQEARHRAEQEYDRIVADAEKKARAIVSAAEKKAAQEQERVMAESREIITALVLDAACSLMRSDMDGEKNSRLVKALLTRKDVPA